MDFTKKEDRRHLMDMVEHSRDRLDYVRNSRRKLLARTKGSEWFPNSNTIEGEERCPFNQMSQQEWALVQHLVGGDPKALVVPGGAGLKAAAYEQTLAINAVAQAVGLKKKFRRLVMDALYGGIGICQIRMAADYSNLKWADPTLDEEVIIGPGSRPEVQVISLEAWVHDCQADSLKEAEFCGHSYWVPREQIKRHLPNVDLTKLQVEEKRFIDEHGHEMAGAISRGTGGAGGNDLREKYWLWDLWIPGQNVMVTTPVGGTGEHAHVRPWRSRPGGPYLYLCYRELPDQAIPVSVMADIAPLHDALASTFEKLINQTKNAKTVLGYKPGHEDDAERIRDASNFQIVQMRDPDSAREFNYNGPDQAILATGLQLRELSSIQGGNTDTLAGLGSQAPTATQEQMISEGASGKVQLHEVDTADFQVKVFNAIRWYIYHEQEAEIPIVGQVEGTDIRFSQTFNAEKAAMMPGEFDSFQMQIEPYTNTYRAPEQRFQMLLHLWERLIMPGVQMGVLDGTPNMDRLLAIAAQYLDMPELLSLIRQVAPEEQAMMAEGAARQSPTTTRNYTRRSAPGPTHAGNAMAALQMMGASNGQSGA
jgi:hypothetical protein